MYHIRIYKLCFTKMIIVGDNLFLFKGKQLVPFHTYGLINHIKFITPIISIFIH